MEKAEKIYNPKDSGDAHREEHDYTHLPIIEIESVGTNKA